MRMFRFQLHSSTVSSTLCGKSFSGVKNLFYSSRILLLLSEASCRRHKFTLFATTMRRRGERWGMDVCTAAAVSTRRRTILIFNSFFSCVKFEFLDLLQASFLWSLLRCFRSSLILS